MSTLNLNRVVNVSMVFSPVAASIRGFGTLLIIGDTAEVLGESEAYRTYNSSDDVITDFGTDAPESLAAQAYFGQSPKPKTLLVANKAKTATLAETVSKLLADYGRNFYGLALALSETVPDDDYFQIAQLIEASSDSHIFGITLTDKKGISDSVYSENSVDLASKLKRGSYTRTIVFYADYNAEDSAYALNKYFGVSALGRMFSVNFYGSRTTLTLKFKQAPSIQPSALTTTEVTNLEARNINVYAMYENDTYIIEQGVMASGMWADERHGTDWLQNAIQTEVYNLLYQSKTKIPQTNDGVNMIISRIANTLNVAVNNGLVAAGTWNSDGFGDLAEGDYLDTGYYIYAESIDDQLQSEREARHAPAIQCAIKLAGAIHDVDITVNVNR
jgi:hypothetical protein